MSTPPPSHKLIAKAAASAFIGQPRVDRYWDEHHKSSVDVLSCTDSPWPGITSYATLGASDIPLVKNGKKLNVRAELVGACRSQVFDFANVLATAAFLMANSGWFVAPGIIFPDVLGMHRTTGRMKHILFLPPFLWEGRLKSLEVGGKQVAWLLAVPISQSELLFAESRGVPALETLFQRNQIDVFDLDRDPVV